MRKNYKRRRGWMFGQILLKPLALSLADLEPRLDTVVETGHGLHALRRGHLARRPEILFIDTMQHHHVHALPVERIGRRAEQLLPFVAQVELARASKLRQITAIEYKVGLRVERVYVIHRLDDAAHEALIERALVKM